MTLLDRYHSFIQQLHRDGVPTKPYNCPACHRDLETQQPAAGEDPYDTLARCPYCLAYYFLVVPAEGSARVRLIDDLEDEARQGVAS